MRLEFKRIITMIVQTIMLVGEVFQIEVSDGLVHPFGNRQNVNLHPAVVMTGARIFRWVGSSAWELSKYKLVSS